MKLCPQCEFLYEDDQGFCDMDGEGLVHDTRTEASLGAVPSDTSVRPKNSRRRSNGLAVAAGLLLSLPLTIAYLASSPSVDAGLLSRSQSSETNLSQIAAPVDNSSSQPAPGPSEIPTNTDAAPTSAAEPADELTDKPVSISSRTLNGPRVTKNGLRAIDSRLTIPKRLPPLPQLNPLPRLAPPQRLAAATPATKVRTATPEKQTVTNQQSAATESDGVSC